MPTSCCYALAACRGNRTYIGVTYTHTLLRRLRQHNGRRSGGARYTARFRPWRMVAVALGFGADAAGRSAALRFEWACKRVKTPSCVRNNPVERAVQRLVCAVRSLPGKKVPSHVHIHPVVHANQLPLWYMRRGLQERLGPVLLRLIASYLG